MSWAMLPGAESSKRRYVNSRSLACTRAALGLRSPSDDCDRACPTRLTQSQALLTVRLLHELRSSVISHGYLLVPSYCPTLDRDCAAARKLPRAWQEVTYMV